MDKEKLEAAKTRVSSAKTALSAAQADLKKAEDADPKDDAAIATAKEKVESAQSELTEAEADVIALGGDEDPDPDAADIVDDITAPEKKLNDGTPADKKISISKDKFDDLNEKAKLLDQFSPVLAKLQKDPELVKRLMAGDDPSLSVPDRLAALEKRDRDEKRAEVTKVINAAIRTWSDFKEKWGQIKPILTGLEAQGVDYAEAVQRAYFAVNPEAAAANKRITDQLQARQVENKRGSQRMNTGGGGPKGPGTGEEDAYELNAEDQDFARATGLDPKLYGKHAEHIRKFADL